MISDCILVAPIPWACWSRYRGASSWCSGLNTGLFRSTSRMAADFVSLIWHCSLAKVWIILGGVNGVPSTFRISLANKHNHLHSDSWSSVSKMSYGHLSLGQRWFLWDNQDVKRWTDQSVDFWVFCGIIGFCAASTFCCETSAKRSQDGLGSFPFFSDWAASWSQNERARSFPCSASSTSALIEYDSFSAISRSKLPPKPTAHVQTWRSCPNWQAAAKTNCASADMT